MSADQVTKHRVTKPCGGCGVVVLHIQVATFAPSSGFKSYELVPRAHRRADGASCTFKADLRKQS